MESLNLKKVWEIMNKVSNKQYELSEQDINIDFMGYQSSYSETSFKSFLECYSFKIEKDEIIIFNNDEVPYEDYNNDDFSYIPSVLLSFSGGGELDNWITTEIDLQLAKQKHNKLQEKENLKLQIEQLTKQLNNL